MAASGAPISRATSTATRHQASVRSAARRSGLASRPSLRASRTARGLFVSARTAITSCGFRSPACGRAPVLRQSFAPLPAGTSGPMPARPPARTLLTGNARYGSAAGAGLRCRSPGHLVPRSRTAGVAWVGSPERRPLLPQLRLDDLLSELQVRLQDVLAARDRVHALLEAV